MEYKITVAKHNGQQEYGPVYYHFFTAENIREKSHALWVYSELKKKFPGPEYKVHCTRWDTTGVMVFDE